MKNRMSTSIIYLDILLGVDLEWDLLYVGDLKMKTKKRTIDSIVLIIYYLLALSNIPFCISNIKLGFIGFVMDAIFIGVWIWVLYKQTKKFLDGNHFKDDI